MHLIVPPTPARLHATVMQWFADAGERPSRVSLCNNISATLLTVLHGTGVGILPVRILREELANRTIKALRVLPQVPPHHVSICYQVSAFGPGLRTLVDLTRELVAQHDVFA